MAGHYNANAYSDWQSAIAHKNVQVVSVCTPARYHRDISVYAASNGIHVLCEKPMALTLSEADDMIQAATDNAVQLVICHQYRGLSRYRTIKQLIDNHELGSPVYIRFMEMREVRPKLAMHTESLSGGPIHDMSGHLFDLARYFTGCNAVSVSAIGGIFGKDKPRLAGIDKLGIDTADIQLRMEQGHCVNIAINWGLPEGTPSYSHESFYGPHGVVYTQNHKQLDINLGELSEHTEVILKNGAGTRSIACESDDDGPKVCVADLVSAINTGKSGEFNAKDAREALKMILASLESIRSGASVELYA